MSGLWTGVTWADCCPFLGLHLGSGLSSPGSSLALVSQPETPPLPSAHLAHQPQHIFGVLSSLFQVLDGFLHDVGLIGGEVHPAFEHIALGRTSGKGESPGSFTASTRASSLPPSTILGITSCRSQGATSSAGWSLLPALPVTSCCLSPSKSVRIHLLRTRGLVWQLPAPQGPLLPTSPPLPTPHSSLSLLTQAPFPYLQGLVTTVRSSALGLGRGCSWSFD